MMQTILKRMKPRHMWNHIRILCCESYPMNTNSIRFRCFSKILAPLCTKVIVSLEGLIGPSWP